MWTTESYCTFQNQTEEEIVQLSWNPPLIGAECCLEYALVNLDQPDFNITTSNTTATVPLDNSRYIVQCRDENGDDIGPPSITLHIQPGMFSFILHGVWHCMHMCDKICFFLYI